MFLSSLPTSNRLYTFALNIALAGLVNFVIIKAIICLYNMAGAYNGDYSFIVFYAYWVGMGLVYLALMLAGIVVFMEGRTR